MRIHTDKVLSGDLLDAARKAGVTIETAGLHNSRSRDYAWEIHLSGDSRRRPNRPHAPDEYAATWDQWGIFLGHLYSIDPNMICGTAKRPVYADAGHFDYRTNWRFNGGPIPFDMHGDHTFRFAGVPFEQECTKCSAVTRWE